MTPTQIKEAYSLVGQRDTIRNRITKVTSYGPKVNVYLGVPALHDPYCYRPSAVYVENFAVSSQIVIDALERELTEITNKLKELGVTD